MITVSTTLLKAMASAAATDPVRRVLNSIFLERTQGKLRLTSTNGRILASVLILDCPVEDDLLESGVMLPLSIIPTLSGKTTRIFLPTDENPRIRVNNLHVEPGEGTYPEYRKVLRKCDAEPGFGQSLMNPAVAETVLKLVRQVTGKKGHCRVYHTEASAPFYVRFATGTLDGIALWMPVAAFNQYGVRENITDTVFPDWVWN